MRYLVVKGKSRGSSVDCPPCMGEIKNIKREKRGKCTFFGCERERLLSMLESLEGVREHLQG